MRSAAEHLPRSGLCAAECSEQAGVEVADGAVSEADGAGGGQHAPRLGKAKKSALARRRSQERQSQWRSLWRGGAPDTAAACKPQAGERHFAGQRSGAAAAEQEVRR